MLNNNKLRIYIDEVGNSDLASSDQLNHRFLSLTGVVLSLDYVKDTLTPDIEELKRKYFNSHPDDPIILHRKEIIHQKYPFQSLKNIELKKSFNRDFLSLLNKWQFKIISVLIDKQEHKVKYEKWRYDPYHYGMAIIFERFHLRLKEIELQGDMMFESRGGKEDTRLKESYRNIIKNGTDYISPKDIEETLTSVELKIKPKSANISGLQLADLLAFPVRRFTLNHYNIAHDNRITFNEEIISVIKPKFFTKDDKLDCYGLKLLP